MTKLDPGLHHGVLTGQSVTEAKSGNLQVELQFSIYEGVDRTVFLPLTDKARESFVDAQLLDLGFNGNFEDPKFREDLYTDGIDLWLKYETYENKEREKWGISSGGGGTPAPADKLKRLNAQWKAKNGAPPKPAGRPGAPAPKPAAPSGPPPKKEKPFGKDEAWEAAEKGFAPAVPDTDQWQAAIDEQGDDEEKFGETEWRAVANKFLKF